MQRLRILEFLGFRCGEKKEYSLKHGIYAFFTKKKKERGRIASWVIENLLEMRPNRPK